MTKLFSVRFQTDTECLTSDTERDKFHPSTMKRTQSSVAKQQFQGDFPVPGLAPVLWRSQTPLCCLGILLQEFYPEQFSSSDHLILPFLSLCSSSQAALCGCSATRAPPGMHELSLTLTLIPENPVPSLQLPALSLQLGFAGRGSAHGWMSTCCSTLIALEQLGSCRNNFLPSQGWFFIFIFFFQEPFLQQSASPKLCRGEAISTSHNLYSSSFPRGNISKHQRDFNLSSCC